MRICNVLVLVMIWSCSDDRPLQSESPTRQPGVATPAAPLWDTEPEGQQSSMAQPSNTVEQPLEAPGPQNEDDTVPSPDSNQPMAGQGEASDEPRPVGGGVENTTDNSPSSPSGGIQNPAEDGIEEPEENMGGSPDPGMNDVVPVGGQPAPIGGEPNLAEPEPLPPVECHRISDLNPKWEVCVETQDECRGVFTDGSGCQAFCAAAGLVCTARYAGTEGCGINRRQAIPCLAQNGNRSDWCECGRPGASSTNEDEDEQHIEEPDGSCESN